MKDQIFRQYDIRGKVGSELVLDDVYALTKAIAYYFKKRHAFLNKVAVGADGRIHSPFIKQEVCRALADSGLDVVFIGVCPTPVLYFSLFTLPVQAGLMITASHNGKEYNGIKLCLDKESVWGDEIQEIKKLFHERKFVQTTKHGSYEEYPLINDYVPFLVKQFSSLVGMDLPVLIDCGNGAAGTVLPQLIAAMQWQQVSLLFPEVDGNYPNHEADPIVEKNMAELKTRVVQGPYALGIGFDGDCDRMAPITKKGELVPGDKLLALFAQPILAQQPGAIVVFDIKCSSGLPQLITQWGGVPFMSATGHSIIKDQLKKHKAPLAGELSCHFFFNDRYFGYDDGIYAALRLLELLQKSGKTLDELLAIFPKKFSTPEIRLACSYDVSVKVVEALKKHFAAQKGVTVMTIDGVRVSMEYGWGIARASNTQPVLCLRFEADSPAELLQIKESFFAVLLPYVEKSTLQNYMD